MAETIVETKACKHCWAPFTITDKDLEFYDKISPVFWWKKYSIPSPTFCPDCRQQRRLSFRNERKLYKRNCDASGKQIISVYSPDKPYKVYEKKEWFADGRDPLSYGRDFDFSKMFFQQYEELIHEVPRMSLVWQDRENSDYVNQCIGVKNCYLVFRSTNSEDCLYGREIFNSQDIVDGLDTIDCSNSYYLVSARNVTNSNFIINSNNLSNCAYMFDCHDCSDCRYCYNLYNKQYHILNKQYSKEEYFEKIQELPHMTFQEFYNTYVSEYIVKNINIIQSPWCKGNDIEYSSESEGYTLRECDHCKFCYDLKKTQDTYDSCFSWGNRSLDYECVATGKDGTKLTFSYNTTAASNSFYLQECFDNCQDCFWCVSLRNKQYCIFNKQYTQEEYETLVPKIIEHMQKTWERWEFFPVEISQFGYNETLAQEYFPLSREEALAKWYKRQDKEYSVNTPENSQIIKAQDIPQSIKWVTDDILNKVILCEITWKPFRIIKPELEFYRKHNLPLPIKHPDQRHLERMQVRTSRKLRDRKCAKCWADIKTTYSPERPEIVYCESCYTKEIYW